VVKRCPPPAPPPITPADFPRADPAELVKFDPATRWCHMNCGKHRQDPRTFKEIKLLCNDCLEMTP
jgi:hypothetical protein